MKNKTIGWIGTGLMGGPMAMHLVDAGYKIDSALKSGHAIKLLTSCKYDLVVLDISMPTLSGFDFVQLMESFHIDSKIVFLTNLDDEETMRKVKKIKINRLISKEKELDRLPEMAYLATESSSSLI